MLKGRFGSYSVEIHFHTRTIEVSGHFGGYLGPPVPLPLFDSLRLETSQDLKNVKDESPQPDLQYFQSSSVTRLSNSQLLYHCTGQSIQSIDEVTAKECEKCY